MICILHGYLLEGSGSNLWTRSIIQSLCRSGETVHLVCQENHPDIYDFISAVYCHGPDGETETVFERDVPYPGRCVMHKPYIGETLPVYVWDKYEEYSDVRPMIQLNDAEIATYLDHNVRALEKIVDEYGISAIHANHAVLMSVVARRAAAKFDIPFAVMPHGSALEYAVKKDKRFFDFASDAFSAANRIFVIGKEIRSRMNAIFPKIADLDEKMTDLNLGVDTNIFAPIDRDKRGDNVELLYEALAGVERGKTESMSARFLEAVKPEIGKTELIGAIRAHSDYNAKNTDENAETKLKSVDWQNDKTILFVGRLIASKGIQLIIAALPFIFEKHPRAKLVVVGHGPLREPLEALVHALETGARALARNIAAWGTELEGSGTSPLTGIEHYFDKLEAEGKLEAYFDAAQKHVSRDRIIFTGYLRHRELRYLFPACDAAVFPSVVAEAGPLVFLEAMASGCFPVGTYFAGMAASIDSLSGSVPDNIADLMKISADEKETVGDIVAKIQGALDVDPVHKAALRKTAVEKYDWGNISNRLAGHLSGKG